MSCCVKELSIKIIQGDSFKQLVKVENIDLEYISAIYFTCEKLGIQKQLPYDSELERFVLEITSDETKDYDTFFGTYDLTIYFNSDDVKTAIYEANIEILPKSNKVVISNE